MTDDATYRNMKQERDLALSECERLKKINSDLCRVHNGHLVEAARLERECERLNDTLDKLVQWSDAYPIAVFPEPDFLKAQKVLSENGMTLDAISSSNMRRVIIGVREIIDAARGKP